MDKFWHLQNRKTLRYIFCLMRFKIEGVHHINRIASLSFSSSIVYHRPVGVFEFEKFSAGTKSVMNAVVEATKNGTTTIIGELFI